MNPTPIPKLYQENQNVTDFVAKHEKSQTDSFFTKINESMKDMPSWILVLNNSNPRPFIDNSTRVTVNNGPGKTDAQKKQENHRAIAAIGGLLALGGAVLYYSLAGRIKQINREVAELHNLNQELSGDKVHIENQEGIRAFFSALESKKDALEEEKRYLHFKTAATIAVVVSGIFAVSAFLLTPQFVGLAGVCLGLSVLAGVMIKSKEHFVSDIADNNKKTTQHLQKFESEKKNFKPTIVLDASGYEYHFPQLNQQPVYYYDNSCSSYTSTNSYVNSNPTAPPEGLEEQTENIYTMNGSFIQDGITYSADGSSYYNLTTNTWCTLDNSAFFDPNSHQWVSL